MQKLMILRVVVEVALRILQATGGGENDKVKKILYLFSVFLLRRNNSTDRLRLLNQCY